MNDKADYNFIFRLISAAVHLYRLTDKGKEATRHYEDVLAELEAVPNADAICRALNIPPTMLMPRWCAEGRYVRKLGQDSVCEIIRVSRSPAKCAKVYFRDLESSVETYICGDAAYIRKSIRPVRLNPLDKYQLEDMVGHYVIDDCEERVLVTGVYHDMELDECCLVIDEKRVTPEDLRDCYTECSGRPLYTVEDLPLD